MKALILGAGYATRLYPLTKTRPKPLLPVAGRPMVEWILDRLAGVREIDQIHLVANATFFGHFEQWRGGHRGKAPLDIVNDGTTSDADKKGAVGDLDLVIRDRKIDDDLVVVAGDNLFDFDVLDFVTFARRQRGAPAIALKDLKDRRLARKKFSTVGLGPAGRITSFVEKPEDPPSSLISICLYFLPRQTLPLVREYLEGGGNPDAPGYYIQWLVKRTPSYGFVFDSLWFDIGDIDSYNQANAMFKKRQKNIEERKRK